MLNKERKLQKLLIKFIKAGENLLKRLNKKEYFKIRSSFPRYSYYEGKELIITNNKDLLERERKAIVATLKEINYTRKTKWTSRVVVGFIHEVLEYYNSPQDSDSNVKLQEISKRYNIKPNRLKSQMALFLTNYLKNHDNYDLDLYFEEYDLLKWRYRDIINWDNYMKTNKIDSTLLNKLLFYDIIKN